MVVEPNDRPKPSKPGLLPSFAFLVCAHTSMPDFPKPTVSFTFNTNTELAALRAHKQTRGIPAKTANSLLVATWNIANLGTQDREARHYSLIAEILSWFDLIAIQEVKDELGGLEALCKALGGSYRMVFTDTAGNNERLAYIYDSKKVRTLELVGELALPPKDLKHIKLPGVTETFNGFDRNPFVQSFQAGNFPFVLANVHLYFGSDDRADIERRQLETFALARWAKLQTKSTLAYEDDVILLGDFNLPKMEPNDPIYSVLVKHGLKLTEHSTEIGTTLKSASGSLKEVHHYDQIAFFPKMDSHYTKSTGVFDFDTVIFKKLWEAETPARFNAYLRYYISDHRPLWAKFKC
jgi:endonuclease/exonuclease/phosphatase family metal-dependent hydrolase